MAWQNITTQEIETGEPVSSETASKIRNNLELLQDRTSTLEGGGSTVYPAMTLGVEGAYGESGDLTIPALGFVKTTNNFNYTITGVRILIDKAGISGTTEIDLKVKRVGSGTYASIFVTRPSVSYSLGDDSVSTNATLNLSEINIMAGDVLRLDITDAQKRAANLLVRIDYTKT